MADQAIKGFNSQLARMLGLDANKVTGLTITVDAGSTEVDATMVLDGVTAEVSMTYSLPGES